MPEPVRLARLLAALSLTMCLLSAAQAQTPALTDLERAQRDADKVLNFIKFQTVKTKPAAEPNDKPRKPAAPKPTASARPAEVAAAATPPVVEPAAAPAAQAAARTGGFTTTDPTPAMPTPTPATSFAAPAAAPAVADTAAEADDPDETALQLQNFVAPVLSPSLQATLGSGSRKVMVRFTVEANGTVSQAEAAPGVPRRFVRPATEAVLQWRFAPLAQARTVDVEIDFRRE